MLRKILLGLGLLFGLALVGVLIIWHRVDQQLTLHGIEHVDWQGLRLERRGLYLEQLQLLHRDSADSRLMLTAQGTRLQVAGLAILRLDIQHLELDWHPSEALQPARAAPPTWRLEELRDALAFAPQQAQVDTWRLTLPCQQTRCTLAGQLRWQRPAHASSAEASVALLHDAHRLTIEASLAASDSEADLLLRLLTDGNPRLESRHRLTETNEGLDWRGSLALAELPEAAWLIDWLAPWTSFQLADLPAIPEQMRLGASWALVLPDFSPARASGALQAALHLPAPWPVPGLGLIEGDLSLALQGAAGQWRPTALDGALRLRPQPEHLAALPPAMRPNSLDLIVKPTASEQPTDALQLAVDIRSDGPLPLRLHTTELELVLSPLSVRTPRAELSVMAKDFTLEHWRARDLGAQLAFALHYAGGEFTLTGQTGSKLRAARLSDPSDPSLDLRGIDLALEALTVTGATQTANWTASLRPTLRIAQLDHPLLHAQSWHWSGEVTASPNQASANGTLRNDAGLSGQTQLNWRAASATRLAVNLDELFLRAGNPLAATASDWPEALTLTQGRLRTEAALTWAPGASPQARLQVDARSLGGVYDRSEFSGLTGQADLAAEDQRVRLVLDSLRIEQLNPGLALGPLTFAGNYQAPLAAPLSGTLAWREARLRVLGGELRAQPGQQPFDGPAPLQQITIDGLELAELLAAYPAEGLSGDGTLDGELQLRYAQGKLIVEQGQVNARSAGTLRFDSPRIAALGRTNPAMQLVAEALRNFRFDLLSSDIRYDENGLLRLGVRLHGRNPELERGRPVHFNINLEEDIPALLTSLQLSDRVSETIQRRVQERLRQSGPRPTP